MGCMAETRNQGDICIMNKYHIVVGLFSWWAVKVHMFLYHFDMYNHYIMQKKVKCSLLAVCCHELCVRHQW